MPKNKETNGKQPATQDDLASLGGELTRRLDEHDDRFEKLEALILSEGEKTRREFRVVAENIHQDVAGANADEISLVKDHVRKIEKHVGITPVIR